MLSVNFYSQNETRKWYFGNLAGLDFLTSPPTILTNGQLNSAESSATISDANGNLLFYTDGTTIWNQTHAQMANGTGLFGHTSTTQGAVIAKQPGSNNIYYVFTLSVGQGSLFFSIVDMNLAAGMGSVTVKNAFLQAGCTERMAAIKHCNGVDIWIVTHDFSNSNFRSFLLTNSGVSLPVTSAVGTPINNNGWVGCMKIAPNGKKLAVGMCANGMTNPTTFELFDYDASTGVVSNPLVLMAGNACGYGVEFSPDGTKLYATRWQQDDIYQWNVCAGSGTAIIASFYSLQTSSGGKAALQLAPNGKIYAARQNQNALGVINNPNVAGVGCSYVETGQSIAPRINTFSLPLFVNSYFIQQPSTAPFTYTQSNAPGCHTASFTAPSMASPSLVGCFSIGYSVTGVQWNFGDPLSGASNTSTLSNPIHVFTSFGTYTPQLIIYYSCGGGIDTLTQQVIINYPCISVNSTAITCANLGSATVQTTGGTGPYSYTWLPTSQTTAVAGGLAPGSYTITVFDVGSNLTYTAQTVLSPLIPLTGNLSHAASVTCHGANTATGAISSLAGGSGSQSYAWSNGQVTYTTAFTNSLSAGLWSVNVTDALTGCQFNNVFLVLQPPAQSLLITASAPSVCLGSPVSFTGQASGGTPGYSYSWTAGPAADELTVTPSTPGMHHYTLTAFDSYSCPLSQTVAADIVPAPSLTVASTSICPLETGTVSAGGASSYTWSNNSNNSSITGNPLITTVYTVTGEALGCISVSTATIQLKPTPNPLITSNSPRCEQSTLNLFAWGGAGFTWDGPMNFSSSQQNPLINNLQLGNAGVYNLTVTAANGCTASTSGTVIVNTIPTVAATAATVCTSQTLNLSASSVPGAVFQWSGPLVFTSVQQNPFIANPQVGATGNYTVRATSAEGCTNIAVASALVVPPPSLTTLLSSPSLCAQAFNGSPNSIMLNASGGQSYTLTTPGQISTNSPPPWSLGSVPPYPGTIIVATASLVGSNGICTSSTTASFSVIPNPTVWVSNPTPVICAGESYTYNSNGASSYVWTASTPNFTSYSNGGMAVANPSINSVLSVVGSSLGCYSALYTSSLTVHPLPEVSVTPTQTFVCIGSAATLQAHGNATSYSWTPSAGLSATSGDVVHAKPATEQQYAVTGSANNCTKSALATVSVKPLPKPVASISSPTVCMNGQVVLNGSGGVSYLWKGPNTIKAEGKTVTVTATSLIYSGDYSLTVIDASGCANSTVTSLSIKELPTAGLWGTRVEGCVPFCSDFAVLSQEPVSVRWELQGKSINTPSFSHCFQMAGIHIITGKLTDPKTGCLNSQSFTVTGLPVPKADFYWLPEKPVEGAEHVMFYNSSQGEDQATWDWYLSSDGHRSTNENTSYYFGDAGNYPVAFVVGNRQGCADTVVKSIRIEGDFACYIPNAFTPDGNGKNDLFLPVVRGVSRYSLSVFNRWGERVFTTSDHTQGWDGTFQGELCKPDVYVYRLNLVTIHGDPKEYSGQVFLYR